MQALKNAHVATLVGACLLGALGCGQDRLESGGDDAFDTADSGVGGIVTDVPAPTDVVVTFGADSQPEPDVSVSQDVGQGACPAAGEYGCPCEANSDCNSGYCVDGRAGRVCTQTCSNACPDDWKCLQYLASLPDVVYLCVDPFVSLCRPCVESGPCNGGKCVDYGPELGSFCGSPCDDEADCPSDYLCQKTGSDTEGQCVSSSGDCVCTEKTVSEGASTSCVVTNESGTCEGKRVCLLAGVVPECGASEPDVEVCDGLDNDCDGQTDEAPTTCGAGRVCDCTDEGCACDCEEGTTLCGDSCVDVLSSTDHCGGCDHPCDAVDVKVAACSDGSCKVVACENGLFDKDGVFETGCECAVSAETCDGLDNDCNGQIDEGGQLCGGVGACAGVCEGGACSCPAGCEACDGTCRSIESFSSDPENCGGCGEQCALDNVEIAGCQAGECSIVKCVQGFKSCDGIDSSGCEWELSAEECDGVDNDCDGKIDEGPAPLCTGGQVCDSGQCVCAEGETWCDGKCVDTDTSLTHCGDCGQPCFAELFPNVISAMCVAAQCLPGVCAPGTFDTDPDTPGCECKKTSVVESCDGVDEDCDGEVDEQATCQAKRVCLAGQCVCDPNKPELLECDGQCVDAFTTVESCGKCGNDCSKKGAPNVDGVACVDGFCAITACHGTFKNIDGEFENGCECDNNAVVELCDGKDNDCDGEVDEAAQGVGEACQTGLPGACKEGSTVCSGGELQCAAKLLPGATETCNGVDDDCDGVIDDDVPGLGEACTVPGAVGPCEQGVTGCVKGGVECVPSAAPKPELCDGADNDCDGVVDNAPVDEGMPCETDLPGVCKSGKTICTATGPTCVATVQPGDVPESCNGKDDDCNGAVDDGDPGAGLECQVPGKKGECAKGTTSCVEGGTVCSSDVVATQEECDGLDNDCNGAADDGIPGVGEACSVSGAKGACAEGEMQCGAGGLKCTATVQASPELCDGVDNNCNGSVDEGNPEGGALCVVAGGKGQCGFGVESCSGGDIVCEQVNVPEPEVCNGKDDDCNGKIDDNSVDSGSSCTVPGKAGPCASGVQKCNAGSLVCTQTTFPGAEICDGADNDCNGATDEENAGGCVSYLADFDGDGFAASGAQAKCLCAKSSPFTATKTGDCNDSSGQAYPGATETCDGIDNNCNFQTDEQGSSGCTNWYVDSDGDGWAASGASSQCLCASSYPYVVKKTGDCDDNNSQRSPGASEKCDGVDNDCDYEVDEAGASGCNPLYWDGDSDGYGADGASSKCLCAASGSYKATNKGDCDDGDFYKHPGAKEVWDIRDNDCDGVADEDGLTKLNRYYRDWTTHDYEHRFATSAPSSFMSDGHWMKVYPLNVCTNAQYKPFDTCTVKSNGDEVIMWGGSLDRLGECKGITPAGAHLTLYLLTIGGEYSDYSGFPSYTCKPIGYVLGGNTHGNMANSVHFYRHASDFSAEGASDNMWSSDPTEGQTNVPKYGTHISAFWVPYGY